MVELLIIHLSWMNWRERAFSLPMLYAYPLCTPTRVSLMTGQVQLPKLEGLWYTGPEAEKTFGHLFQAQGYTLPVW